MYVREFEPPLGADADERPEPEAWEAMLAEAMAVPVPAYDGRPVLGLVKPRRDRG